MASSLVAKFPGGEVIGDTVFTADLAWKFCNDRCNCLNQIYQGSSNLKTHNCSNKAKVFFFFWRQENPIRYQLYQTSVARVSNIPVTALFRDSWNPDSLVYSALVKRKINYIDIKQSTYLAIVTAETAIPHRKSNHCGILSLQGEVMISFFPWRHRRLCNQNWWLQRNNANLTADEAANYRDFTEPW